MHSTRQSLHLEQRTASAACSQLGCSSGYQLGAMRIPLLDRKVHAGYLELGGGRSGAKN
jgi:hypothetical protein